MVTWSILRGVDSTIRATKYLQIHMDKSALWKMISCEEQRRYNHKVRPCTIASELSGPLTSMPMIKS